MINRCEELQFGDVGELYRYLRGGFGGDSASIHEDVLAWKYFDRNDADRPVSYVMRDASGNICAHVGATYSRFLIPGMSETSLRAMFPTDWLSTQPGAGLKLVNVALADTPILYAIGGTSDADRALRAARCKQIGSLSLMRRFPGSRGAIIHAFQSGGGAFRKAARAARDSAQSLAPLADEMPQLSISRLSMFSETDLVQSASNSIHTRSSVEQLNHMLRHPRGVITGWRISRGGSVIGYAMLSLLPDPRPVRGKIIECQLTTDNPQVWAALLALLTRQLGAMGAAVITSLVSTQFLREAFDINNYRRCGASNLLVRSSAIQSFLAHPFMLSLREGDISYV